MQKYVKIIFTFSFFSSLNFAFKYCRSVKIACILTHFPVFVFFLLFYILPIHDIWMYKCYKVWKSQWRCCPLLAAVAIITTMNSALCNKMGLVPKQKPIRVMIMGQPGVGKTGNETCFLWNFFLKAVKRTQKYFKLLGIYLILKFANTR